MKQVTHKYKIRLGFLFIGILAILTFTAFLIKQNSEKPIQIKSTLEKVEGAIQVENKASVATFFDKKEVSPKYFYFNKASQDLSRKIKVSAEAYIVGDLNTGEIIMAKNATKELPIASVTKLMTATLTKELDKGDETAKVSRSALATYGQNGNFRLGQNIKTDDLLYPLLLESSNDASEVLAEYFGRDQFLRKMNLLAEKLNMDNTTFSDPSGLSSKNVSTAADLFKLTGYIKHQRPEILKISTNRSYTNKVQTWFSHNQFLRENGYTGGKSGYTNPAKQTVVSTFALPLGEEGTRPIGITLLRSSDRYKDVLNIVNYLKKNIYYGGESDASADWINQKLGIPELRDPDYLTLGFAGDMMLDRGVRSSVNKNFDGDYSALFEHLDIMKKYDVMFANLEGPASDQGKDLRNLYSFRMNPSIIPALRGAGISIVSMANNHVGDWGRDAFIDTLSRLEENEILYTGAGTTIQAETPTIVEKYGIKIGYLGFSDVGPNWMAATETQAGLLLANNPRFEEIIKNASAQVDHLIVSFHFGDEYKTTNNARQQTLAHKAIDAGAKVIIGHHPHVVQNTEIYKNGYIAYSLGNFIFDQKFSTPTMEGMILEMKLFKDGSMTVSKHTSKLNSVFQPEKIIKGKEQKVNFPAVPKTQ